MKLNLSAVAASMLCALSHFGQCEGTNSFGLNIVPITDRILKLSWPAEEGSMYHIEQSSDLRGSAWEHFCLEHAVMTNMRRSVVLEEGVPAKYFRAALVSDTNASSTFSSSNLVVNGNMEIADGELPAGWFKGGFGSNSRTHIYPVLGKDGGKAVLVSVTNWSNGDGKWFTEDFPVIGDGTYGGRFAYRSDAPSNLTIRYLLTNGAYIYKGALLPKATLVWSNINYTFTAESEAVSASLFFALTGDGTLAIDDVLVTNVVSLDRGMVSLTIDDGWRESGMVAAEILEKYGGRGTFYIVTPRIGRPGIFTTNDLRDLRLRGHDVDPHSLSHTNLTLSSVEERQVEEEINLSRADILKWGCGPATTFAYPFGAFSESVIRMVREAGMRGACGTDGGLNDMATLEPFALKRRSLQSTSYYWNITAEIDEAVAQKKWLILLVHFVEPVPSHDFSITPEFLEDVIAYAAYKNARIVTVSEGLEIMGQSP